VGRYVKKPQTRKLLGVGCAPFCFRGDEAFCGSREAVPRSNREGAVIPCEEEFSGYISRVFWCKFTADFWCIERIGCKCASPVVVLSLFVPGRPVSAATGNVSDFCLDRAKTFKFLQRYDPRVHPRGEDTDHVNTVRLPSRITSFSRCNYCTWKLTHRV